MSLLLIGSENSSSIASYLCIYVMPIPVLFIVSVCFERGGKISSSNDRSVAFLDDGSIELFCYESLSLVATIYKDSAGAYLVHECIAS